MINAFYYFAFGKKGYFNSYRYPMLESDYPYTSSTGVDSTDCLYSSHKGASVKVHKYCYMIEGET